MQVHVQEIFTLRGIQLHSIQCMKLVKEKTCARKRIRRARFWFQFEGVSGVCK